MMQYKRCFYFTLVCLFVGIFVLFTSCRQQTANNKKVIVQKTEGFPEGEIGFCLGVSACYAGQIDNKLIIAGGCNFPEIPASEGGKKKYYQWIYISEIENDSVFKWKKIGVLPKKAAYGVSVSTGDGIICVAGNNEQGAFSDVFRITLNEDKNSAVIDTLPSLPYPIDNGSGALEGNKLFVVGGNASGKPSNYAFCLDLENLESGWEKLPDFPGQARLQPVSVAVSKQADVLLYLWGGFSPAFDTNSAQIPNQGYCYSTNSNQWTSVSAPKDSDCLSVASAGAVALPLNDSLIVCMGGVNKEIFLSALQREEKLKLAITLKDTAEVTALKSQAKDYMLWEQDKYRFNDKILIYNINKDKWEQIYSDKNTARAGSAFVKTKDGFFYINGELKPGIRTLAIHKISIKI